MSCAEVTNSPLIALTPGEPAGIGPDLIIQLAQQVLPGKLVVIADKNLLAQRAAKLRLQLKIKDFKQTSPPEITKPGELTVLHITCPVTSVCGTPTSENASYVLQTLETAVEGCRKRQFSALVTGPVHKGTINEAGIPFSGHTEFLAKLTATSNPVMLMLTEGLRVALVTTHLALAAVANAITYSAVVTTTQVLQRELQRQFAIPHPRILVCGLNPHAGENGYLGREELDVIAPAIHYLQQQGIDVRGPLAADTIFTPKFLQQADVVLAMYHDQGLPVLKYAGFSHAVNVTLGLPIIRTSVDHGTAFDLAGSGKCDTGSLLMAITTALAIAARLH